MYDCTCPGLWVQDFRKRPVLERDGPLSDALLGNAVCYRARTWRVNPLVRNRDRSSLALVHVVTCAFPRKLNVIQYVCGREPDELHVHGVRGPANKHVEVPNCLSCLKLRSLSFDVAQMQPDTSDACTLMTHAVSA